MAKRFAVLVGVIGLLCGAAGSVRSSLSAQGTGRTIPVTGIVVDGSGAPVAGAHVVLLRHSQSVNGEGGSTLAQADTDRTGAFSFGSINLQTEIRFPLETGARLQYIVSSAGGDRPLPINIEFTAPRSGPDYAVTSVYAKLTVN